MFSSGGSARHSWSLWRRRQRDPGCRRERPRGPTWQRRPGPFGPRDSAHLGLQFSTGHSPGRAHGAEEARDGQDPHTGLLCSQSDQGRERGLGALRSPSRRAAPGPERAPREARTVRTCRAHGPARTHAHVFTHRHTGSHTGTHTCARTHTGTHTQAHTHRRHGWHHHRRPGFLPAS